jgi:hypothetical protein
MMEDHHTTPSHAPGIESRTVLGRFFAKVQVSVAMVLERRVDVSTSMTMSILTRGRFRGKKT